MFHAAWRQPPCTLLSLVLQDRGPAYARPREQEGHDDVAPYRIRRRDMHGSARAGGRGRGAGGGAAWTASASDRHAGSAAPGGGETDAASDGGGRAHTASRGGGRTDTLVHHDHR